MNKDSQIEHLKWHSHNNDELGRNPWRMVDRYGFVDNTQTSLSFNDSNYTLTLTDAGAGWQYMRDGIVNYITGNKTVTLAGTPPTAGIYYIYIDDDIGTLTSGAAWTLADTKVPVCTISWNNSLTPKYLLQDERHTCTIDRKDHRYNHFTRSTQLVSGGALTGYTVGTDSDAAITWAVAETLIADEDLFHTLSALTDGNGAGTPYAVLYRTAASTWAWKLSALPFDYTGSGYINYDLSGTQTQGATNKYYNYWFAYTNITGDFRFVTIPGRAEYSSAAAAYAEDIRSYTWAGLPTAEFCIAYQITYHALASYSGSAKVKIVRVAQLNYANVASGVPDSSGRLVFLAAPLTSTSYDGDSFSTTAKTLIDLSAVFGVPAGVKAILVRVQALDSGSATNATWFGLSPNDTASSLAVVARSGGLPADYRGEGYGLCPCNADGDVYYQCNASGAGTLDVDIQIWGYVL